MTTALALRGSTSLVQRAKNMFAGVGPIKTKITGAHVRAAAAGAGAGYGLMTGEGLGDRLERAVGFGAGIGLATHPGFRNTLNQQSKVMGRAIRRYGTKGGTALMAGRAFGGGRGVALGAGIGGIYGAIDDDTSIIGGATVGAGMTVLGKGAARSLAAGKKFGARTGAAAGGALGLYAGGPVGMGVGVGVGGTVGGVATMYRGANKVGKFAMRAAGAGALFAAGSAAIVGTSAAQAYEMHQQRRNTNFGATGDLTLGLHSLRHG